MKCWIVCAPCEDAFYGGTPTGVVFTDEAKAKEYIERENGSKESAAEVPDIKLNCEPEPFESCRTHYALYLEEGEIK